MSILCYRHLWYVGHRYIRIRCIFSVFALAPKFCDKGLEQNAYPHGSTHNFLIVVDTTAVAYGQRIDQSLRTFVAWNNSHAHKSLKVTSRSGGANPTVIQALLGGARYCGTDSHYQQYPWQQQPQLQQAPSQPGWISFNRRTIEKNDRSIGLGVPKKKGFGWLARWK